MPYFFERDSALRAWECYNEDDKGEPIIIGIGVTDKMEQVNLLKMVISDRLLKLLDGEAGFMKKERQNAIRSREDNRREK